MTQLEVIESIIQTIRLAEAEGEISNGIVADALEGLRSLYVTLKDDVRESTATNSSAISSLDLKLNLLLGGDNSTAIDNFNEVLRFLAGFEDSESLEEVLADVLPALSKLKRDVLNLTSDVKNAGPQMLAKMWVAAGGSVGADGAYAMNGLTDITEEQAYDILFKPAVLLGGHYQVPRARTNIAADFTASFWNGGKDTVSLIDIALNNKVIEVLCLGGENTHVYTTDISHMCRSATNLRRIIGILRDGTTRGEIYTTNAFAGCTSLEDVRIHGLNFSVSFADSPNLSDETVAYLVNNAAANSAVVTVTLHPDVFARLSDNIITTAAAKNISFATL